MKVQALGHLVLKVLDIQRSEAFYNGILGLEICARSSKPNMTFFTLGNHHDLAVMEVSGEQQAAEPEVAGLHHFAFCIGTELSEVIEAKQELEAADIKVVPIDHDVTQSLYFTDPDGNGMELYVDVSDAWRTDPQKVAGMRPLEL